MSNLGGPFDYEQLPTTSGRTETRWQEALAWVATAILINLLPFFLAALSIRIFADAREFPAARAVLGKGDVLLVVLSVIAATVAELAVPPGAQPRAVRSVALIVVVLIGLTATWLFGTVQYRSLLPAGSTTQFDQQTMMDLSLILLGLASLAHLILILTTTPSEA